MIESACPFLECVSQQKSNVDLSPPWIALPLEAKRCDQMNTMPKEPDPLIAFLQATAVNCLVDLMVKHRFTNTERTGTQHPFDVLRRLFWLLST